MCLLEYILQENHSVATAVERKEPGWGSGKPGRLSDAVCERENVDFLCPLSEEVKGHDHVLHGLSWEECYYK